MIPGATSPVYTPAASGQYYVIVSDTITGCPSEHSNTINFLITGVDPLNAAGMVTVYPNPFREYITISYELTETGSVRISLLDAYGKEIRIVQDHLRQTAGTYRFDMAAGSLNTGVYLLKVRTSSYIITKRIVLSH
jgi:hypothetical protein